MWRLTLLSIAFLTIALNILGNVRDRLTDLNDQKQEWVKEKVELNTELLKYRPPFDIRQRAWLFITRYENDRKNDMIDLEMSMHGQDLVATWDSEQHRSRCVAIITLPAWKFRLGPDCRVTP